MYTEEILFKESRIKIVTDRKDLIGKAYDELVRQREHIEEEIRKNKFFEITLEPLAVEMNASKIIREMASAAKIANVGPMAAVAGAIAECVCRKMIESGAEVAVVENGGDIFAIANHAIKVGLFVGKNKFSGKIAFQLDKKNTPISICSSSSLMGHSLSFGKCDLATVFSKNGAIADACATALCNRIKEESDIEPSLKWILGREGVLGAMAIKNDKIGMMGELPPIIGSEDEKISEKVTRDDSWKR
jgi:uncharacterized protein